MGTKGTVLQNSYDIGEARPLKIIRCYDEPQPWQLDLVRATKGSSYFQNFILGLKPILTLR